MRLDQDCSRAVVPSATHAQENLPVSGYGQIRVELTEDGQQCVKPLGASPCYRPRHRRDPVAGADRQRFCGKPRARELRPAARHGRRTRLRGGDNGAAPPRARLVDRRGPCDVRASRRSSRGTDLLRGRREAIPPGRAGRSRTARGRRSATTSSRTRCNLVSPLRRRRRADHSF
jgi:hypothetical protein